MAQEDPYAKITKAIQQGDTQAIKDLQPWIKTLPKQTQDHFITASYNRPCNFSLSCILSKGLMRSLLEGKTEQEYMEEVRNRLVVAS